jgi:hypothetical protein
MTDREQDIVLATVNEGRLKELSAELCFDKLWDIESELPDLDAELRRKIEELWKRWAVSGPRNWEMEGVQFGWRSLWFLALRSR